MARPSIRRKSHVAGHTADGQLAHRRGYDSRALDIEIPTPTLSTKLAAEADSAPLRYCRFSILLSRRSRTPIYAAANIGYDETWGLARSVDLRALHGQIMDPRLSPDQQPVLKPGRSFAFAVPPDAIAYGGAEEAMTAIGDTRFAPNHILVESTLDQNIHRLWHGIEGHLTATNQVEQKRAILFAGAAFSTSFRWKVITTRYEGRGLTSTAFTMQSEGKSKSSIRQVRLSLLEDIVGLSFGPLIRADFLTHNEFPVSDLTDILLPDSVNAFKS